MRWMLFTKSVDVLGLDDGDMTAFEELRGKAWIGTKRDFGL